MTDIYVDPSVARMPNAADQLAHLLDTGHQLVLVGDYPKALLEALPGAGTIEAPPARATAASWYLSSDPAICNEPRPGFQKLLVGPRLAPSPRQGPRCEAEARDLASAVLEILGREVMG